MPGLPKASWVSWVEASRFDAGTAYAAFDRHTFGDMSPWVYKTTDYGETWTRIVAPEQGVRGYAHVIKEDVEDPRILFLGTEFGLWISVDGGGAWAEFKGRRLPQRGRARSPGAAARQRSGDRHPRPRASGSSTTSRPCARLSRETLARPAAFLPSRPVQQRMPAQGGWVEGDAAFVGQNPPGGAVITYYQRARHLFGPLKLEVLDPKGALVDTVDASAQRGINRVHVVDGGEAAARAPRRAGRLQRARRARAWCRAPTPCASPRARETLETKLEIGLDRRATYKPADRKAQFDAAMRVHALFGEMSALADRIDGRARRARRAPRPSSGRRPRRQAPRRWSTSWRRPSSKIVATKEGGAITGEERIREHLDILYGALTSWEGKPARYQVERIDALARELADVSKELGAIVSGELPALDAELKSRGMAPIPTTGAGASRDEDDAAEQGEQKLAEELRCVQSHGRDCDAASRAAAREKQEKD